MKMRLTSAVAARSAWRAAGRSAAGAAILVVSVSACTATGSSVPSIFTPTPTGGATVASTHTPSPSDTGSATREASATATATAPATPTSAPTRAASTAASAPPATTQAPTGAATAKRTAAAPAATATALFPTAAPQTGGGGTAGLQDSLVFAIGGGAVLVGFGSLAYRRRLARKYGAGRRQVDREPLDRKPADY